MRSIRWSLVIYFLLLLLVMEAVVCALVYNTTRETLAKRDEAETRLLHAIHESRCRNAYEGFDKRLQGSAWRLAGYGRGPEGRTALPLHVRLALLRLGDHPHIDLLKPLWTVRLRDNPVYYAWQQEAWRIFVEKGAQTHEDEQNEVEPPTSSAYDTARYYYQIYGSEGRVIRRSDSLPAGAFTLEREIKEKIHDDHGFYYDDLEVGPDVRVRRVTVRASGWGWRPFRPPDNRSPGFQRPPSPAPPARAERTRLSGPPVLYFQFAKETNYLEEHIQEFKDELNHNLEQLDEASQSTLASLRRRLMLIALFTFAATLVGGFWLVQTGLSPLERLTTAVSQVSEKDFRLPMDNALLPRELQPIVQRLSQTLDQLRRAFEHEKQTAADISHELRTPLAALLATIDVTLRKQRSPEEYRTALQECRSSGRQMYQLVERLLTLARLDAGVDRVQRKDVEVTEIAEVCTALVRPLAESRGLQLRFHEAPPLSARADPDKLNEVLNNLLHNAVEYNRDGGSIDVRVGRDNGSVVVEVADTGIGIAPEHRERIFERFYRADPSRQADGLHAGLGLAITKSYVELMGGTISVESREGEGTTFRVNLAAEHG